MPYVWVDAIFLFKNEIVLYHVFTSRSATLPDAVAIMSYEGMFPLYYRFAFLNRSMLRNTLCQLATIQVNFKPTFNLQVLSLDTL